MHRALSDIVVLATLALGLVIGCGNRGETNASGTGTQTGGEQEMVTEDADGKAWVTPDAPAAEQEAEENAIGDAEGIDMSGGEPDEELELK